MSRLKQNASRAVHDRVHRTNGRHSLLQFLAVRGIHGPRLRSELSAEHRQLLFRPAHQDVLPSPASNTSRHRRPDAAGGPDHHHTRVLKTHCDLPFSPVGVLA